MKYKLICIDLDGTMLNNRHQISPYNEEVIHKLHRAGYKVAIVTGRRFKSAFPYAEQLSIKAPLICYNGGMVVDLQGNKILHSTSLSRDYARQVIKLWVTTGAPIFAYKSTLGDPDVYHENVSDHPSIQRYLASQYARGALQKEESLEAALNFDPLCVKTFGWEKDVLNCVNILGDTEVSTGKFLQTKDSDGSCHYYELYPREAQKRFGLQWLSEYYGVEQQEVLAIGDNYNDLDMLEWAGLGIAMGNAVPELKKIANLVTHTNNDDGVGKILSKILL